MAYCSIHSENRKYENDEANNSIQQIRVFRDRPIAAPSIEKPSMIAKA